MAIELSREDQAEAIDAIQDYSEDEMDERLGNIAAGALLEFFLREIGPCIYNKAVADVRDVLQTRLMDLDIEVHEEEFPVSRRR